MMDSAGRKEDVLAEIRHTLNDRKNLHSDRVPVGQAEHYAATAPIPNLAQPHPVLKGGGSVSSLWQRAVRPSPSIYSSIHMFTHSLCPSDVEMFNLQSQSGFGH